MHLHISTTHLARTNLARFVGQLSDEKYVFTLREIECNLQLFLHQAHYPETATIQVL